MSATTPSPTSTLATMITAGQANLGITNRELSDALGLEAETALLLIKQGTMRLPPSKVPALAIALDLNPADLLRQCLTETAPDLLAVIDKVFNPMCLSGSESRLIRHVRTLAGGLPTVPIIFDGKNVVALVMA